MRNLVVCPMTTAWPVVLVIIMGHLILVGEFTAAFPHECVHEAGCMRFVVTSPPCGRGSLGRTAFFYQISLAVVDCQGRQRYSVPTEWLSRTPSSGDQYIGRCGNELSCTVFLPPGKILEQSAKYVIRVYTAQKTNMSSVEVTFSPGQTSANELTVPSIQQLSELARLAYDSKKQAAGGLAIQPPTTTQMSKATETTKIFKKQKTTPKPKTTQQAKITPIPKPTKKPNTTRKSKTIQYPKTTQSTKTTQRLQITPKHKTFEISNKESIPSAGKKQLKSFKDFVAGLTSHGDELPLNDQSVDAIEEDIMLSDLIVDDPDEPLLRFEKRGLGNTPVAPDIDTDDQLEVMGVMDWSTAPKQKTLSQKEFLQRVYNVSYISAKKAVLDVKLAERGPPGTISVGQWTAWSRWSACSVSCGSNGKQTRRRTCSGGTGSKSASCSGEASQTSPCDPRPSTCPEAVVAVVWSAWMDWSACPVSCGQGTRSRERSCPLAPAGLACEGSSSQTKQCDRPPCTGPVMWAAWGKWSECSVTCGSGHRSRVHSCQDVNSGAEGMDCLGTVRETIICELSDCLLGVRVETVQAVEGREAMLRCIYEKLVPPVSIYWLTPDGKKITPQSTDKRYEAIGDTLSIAHAEEDNDGVYQCVVTDANSHTVTGQAEMDVINCASNPCNNGGVCKEGEDTDAMDHRYFSFYCQCGLGYHGATCELGMGTGAAAFLIVLGLLLLMALVAFCVYRLRKPEQVTDFEKETGLSATSKDTLIASGNVEGQSVMISKVYEFPAGQELPEDVSAVSNTPSTTSKSKFSKFKKFLNHKSPVSFGFPLKLRKSGSQTLHSNARQVSVSAQRVLFEKKSQENQSRWKLRSLDKLPLFTSNGAGQKNKTSNAQGSTSMDNSENRLFEKDHGSGILLKLQSYLQQPLPIKIDPISDYEDISDVPDSLTIHKGHRKQISPEFQISGKRPTGRIDRIRKYKKTNSQGLLPARHRENRHNDWEYFGNQKLQSYVYHEQLPVDDGTKLHSGTSSVQHGQGQTRAVEKYGIQIPPEYRRSAKQLSDKTFKMSGAQDQTSVQHHIRQGHDIEDRSYGTPVAEELACSGNQLGERINHSIKYSRMGNARGTPSRHHGERELGKTKNSEGSVPPAQLNSGNKSSNGQSGRTVQDNRPDSFRPTNARKKLDVVGSSEGAMGITSGCSEGRYATCSFGSPKPGSPSPDTFKSPIPGTCGSSRCKQQDSGLGGSVFTVSPDKGGYSKRKFAGRHPSREVHTLGRSDKGPAEGIGTSDERDSTCSKNVEFDEGALKGTIGFVKELFKGIAGSENGTPKARSESVCDGAVKYPKPRSREIGISDKVACKGTEESDKGHCIGTIRQEMCTGLLRNVGRSDKGLGEGTVESDRGHGKATGGCCVCAELLEESARSDKGQFKGSSMSDKGLFRGITGSTERPISLHNEIHAYRRGSSITLCFDDNNHALSEWSKKSTVNKRSDDAPVLDDIRSPRHASESPFGTGDIRSPRHMSESPFGTGDIRSPRHTSESSFCTGDIRSPRHTSESPFGTGEQEVNGKTCTENESKTSLDGFAGSFEVGWNEEVGEMNVGELLNHLRARLRQERVRSAAKVNSLVRLAARRADTDRPDTFTCPVPGEGQPTLTNIVPTYLEPHSHCTSSPLEGSPEKRQIPRIDLSIVTAGEDSSDEISLLCRCSPETARKPEETPPTTSPPQPMRLPPPLTRSPPPPTPPPRRSPEYYATIYGPMSRSGESFECDIFSSASDDVGS